MKNTDPRVIRVREVLENEKQRLSALFEVDLSNVSPCIKPYRGRHLGQAEISRYAVGQSKVIINTNYFQDLASYNHIVNETITHELIHIVNVMKNGWNIGPHGREWKRLMMQAGKSPDRLAPVLPHNDARTNRLLVRCSCGKEFSVTKRAWNRRQVYTHKRCGKFLTEATLVKEV